MVPVGVGAPPRLVGFSGDWDVHWGYGTLTHGHLGKTQTQAPTRRQPASFFCRRGAAEDSSAPPCLLPQSPARSYGVWAGICWVRCMFFGACLGCWLLVVRLFAEKVGWSFGCARLGWLFVQLPRKQEGRLAKAMCLVVEMACSQIHVLIPLINAHPTFSATNLASTQQPNKQAHSQWPFSLPSHQPGNQPSQKPSQPKGH